MNLVQLVYCSKSTSSDKDKNADLKSIHQTAVQTNGLLGISGLLLFSNSYYLQVLEGPRSDVNEVYGRILKDPRHSNSEILLFREIVRRDFGDWSMGWATEVAAKADVYFAYSANRNFDPRQMSGEAGLAMLVDLAKLMRGSSPA